VTWIDDLLWSETVAHTIFLYSVIIAVGVFLGKRKIWGISLGITFVLFAITFTVLLIAEIKIMIKQIKIGPNDGGNK